MRAAVTAFILTIATSATGGIEHTVLNGVSLAGVRVWTGPDTVLGLTKEADFVETYRAMNPAPVAGR